MKKKICHNFSTIFVWVISAISPILLELSPRKEMEDKYRKRSTHSEDEIVPRLNSL